ncbi:ABC transporter ATP-binding protein [Paenibacillus faecalis]|uniref:ABC transporter ATP-binding protein n=1 Tax=Paenibacillus faecalis TaxID=2079532 RepID=UPI000D0FABF5|nr:ABC transporter ATP-binding protein [Paenibacillus faecalis]
MNVVLDVKELSKTYSGASKPSVNALSFSVRAGEIYGLLGPNGAGKTTTIKTLTTRIPLESGSITVKGKSLRDNPYDIRKIIGVVPQEANLDQSLNVVENLTYHASYFGFPRKYRKAKAMELLEQFGLEDKSKVTPGKLSGGMIQRLMIARALMHDPDILFLDEPTTGLDPQSKLFVWERLQELKDLGKSIIITTHNMDEAERLCDRVAIIDHGSLLIEDSPKGLIQSMSDNILVDVARDEQTEARIEQLIECADELEGLSKLEIVSEPSDEAGSHIRLLFILDGMSNPIVTITNWLNAKSIEVITIKRSNASLEGVFIQLTGREIRS